MSTETPRFIGSQYGQMHIIEHLPDTTPPRAWLIMLNSGLQCRSGPRRLYVNVARQIVKLGIGVIRVDLPGTGDSDGPRPPTHFDMHNPLDVYAILEYVNATYQPETTILQGLCAGSRVAIKTAAQREDVHGVLAWSTTIFTATPGSTRPPEEPRHGVSKAVAEYNQGRLSRIFSEAKFLRLSFWRKHLTSSALIPELRSTFWSLWLLARGGDTDAQKGVFIPAIRHITEKGLPVHFVYGERDQYCYQEFRELGLGVPEEDIAVIPDGTHTFSTRAQQKLVTELTCSWLQKLLDSRVSLRT